MVLRRVITVRPPQRREIIRGFQASKAYTQQGFGVPLARLLHANPAGRESLTKAVKNSTRLVNGFVQTKLLSLKKSVTQKWNGLPESVRDKIGIIALTSGTAGVEWCVYHMGKLAVGTLSGAATEGGEEPTKGSGDVKVSYLILERMQILSEANKMKAEAEKMKYQAEIMQAEAKRMESEAENMRAEAKVMMSESEKMRIEVTTMKSEAERMRREADNLKFEVEATKVWTVLLKKASSSDLWSAPPIKKD